MKRTFLVRGSPQATSKTLGLSGCSQNAISVRWTERACGQRVRQSGARTEKFLAAKTGFTRRQVHHQLSRLSGQYNDKQWENGNITVEDLVPR
jgi:hypothetical protein